MAIKRINLISGPRNISTALMYSFGNRKDTTVVDEPMYAYYLKNTDVNHPGKEEILESLPEQLEEVKNNLLFNHVDTPLYFIKNMAHHFICDDWSFLLKMDNVFLIRDLKKLIISFSKVIKNPTLRDIGIKREFEIYNYLLKNGVEPIVLDSGELIKNPAVILQKLCSLLHIPFTKDMLSWAPGKRKEDGVWAKYWYNNVHKTNGFQPRITKDVDMPQELLPLYEEARPYYENLYVKSLKI